MATITALKSQKKKTRANIFLDGTFACGMEISTILQNRLKVGSEITLLKLEEMQKESEAETAFNYALDLIDRQLYTKKAITDKLKSRGYLDSTIDITLEKLEKYGYIDDKKYVEAYLRSVKNKSLTEIKFTLQSKGINRSVIDEVLKDVDNNIEEETITRLSKKFMARKENNEEHRKKLFAYLYRKGFSCDLISRVLTKFED